MEGVIVQVGEPKSIVLFNNGKIGAIPTPEGGRVGMVVTVKPNNRLKILLIAVAAALLLSAGIAIGVMTVSRGTETQTETGYDWQRGQEKRQELMNTWQDKTGEQK
ncbi:hypothetical protein [Breznakiella homolactica]|uniref:Uncharacterized protein n=1 Tax=Breznakiella homolactica TaxID=2798577 RepID=A0A7T7XJZ3_9SPIR|nr:hypothetical protein [Breznakiella homolactica]QQO07809.1 hypothetical protein JFL75_12760 [Breznakiella homolactica]